MFDFLLTIVENIGKIEEEKNRNQNNTSYNFGDMAHKFLPVHRK